MSTTRLTYDPTPAAIDSLPTPLAPSGSKLVYLFLHTAEEATSSDLQSALEMKQLALSPVLEALEGKGLIERDGEAFRVTAYVPVLAAHLSRSASTNT